MLEEPGQRPVDIAPADGHVQDVQPDRVMGAAGDEVPVHLGELTSPDADPTGHLTVGCREIYAPVRR